MTHTLEELIPDYIQGLPAYVPGKPVEEVEQDLKIHAVKLASNENPLGPSPKAMAAARQALGVVGAMADMLGVAICSEAVALRQLGWQRPVIMFTTACASNAADLAELIARVKSINPAVKVAYHSDGMIWDVIPDLIEIGLDVLNPVQPACLDPAELKRRFGDRLCFWGSLDEQHTLPFGSPEDVRAEVRTRLDTIGRRGGLILGPTHHVQLDTPMENFWAMVETIQGRTLPAAAAVPRQ